MPAQVLQRTAVVGSGTSYTSPSFGTGFADDLLMVAVVTHSYGITLPADWTVLADYQSDTAANIVVAVKRAIDTSDVAGIAVSQDVDLPSVAVSWRVSSVDWSLGAAVVGPDTLIDGNSITPDPAVLSASRDYIGVSMVAADASNGVDTWAEAFEQGEYTTPAGNTFAVAHTVSNGADADRTGTTYTSGEWRNNAASDTRALGIIIASAIPPVAEYTWEQLPGTLSVLFAGLSANVAEWRWDFGDGSPISYDQNALHYYSEPGDYEVVLTVVNSAGEDATTQTVTVTALEPTAAFTYTFAPGTRWVHFHDQSLHAESYLWDFGDLTPTSTEKDPAHEYAADGDYIVTLSAYNSDHVDPDTAQRTVHVALTDAPPARQDGLVVALDIEVDGEWKAITCGVQSAGWTFGANGGNGPYTNPTASIFRAVLWDPTRLLDPSNEASPYYGTWDLGTPMRMSIGRPAEGVPEVTVVWQGYMSDAASDMTRTTISGDDGIARLNKTLVDVDGGLTLPTQLTSARINTLLDTVGWPSGYRDIEDGGRAQQGYTVEEDSTTWSALVYANTSELGRLALRADGRVMWRTRDTAWAYTLPVVELGCGRDAELGAVALGGDTDALVTYMQAGAEGLAIGTYKADSFEEVGRYDRSRTDLLLLTQAEVDAWVQHIFDRASRPMWGVRAVRTFLTAEWVGKFAEAAVGDVWRIWQTDDDPHIDFWGRFMGYTVNVSETQVTVNAVVSEDVMLPTAQAAFQPDSFQADSFQTTTYTKGT